MSHSIRVRALAGTFVLVAGLGTLAGCGDSGKTVVTKDGDKVSVDTDKGEVSVQTDQGTLTAGQGVPDGFPKGDVPLLDEKVVTGAKGAAGGPFAWSVVMQTSRAIDDVTAEVKKDFASAGYTTDGDNVMGDVSVLQFKSDKYDVAVTAARTGANVTVTYVVKNPG